MITEEYKSELFKKHTTDPEYGGEAVEYSGHISNIINQTGVETVLDYGAGKGELAHNLVLDHRVKVILYDPAIPQISAPPEPADMVVCVNVLDHVEDQYIDEVLDDIKRCTNYINFIVISETKEKPMEWWLLKIMERFSIQSLVRSDMDFFVITKNEH